MESSTINLIIYYICFSSIWIRAIPLQTPVTETNSTGEIAGKLSNVTSVYKNGKLSLENGNYSAEHHMASSTEVLSLTTSIYINHSEKETTNKKTMIMKSPTPDNNSPEEKTEIATNETSAYSTDDIVHSSTPLITTSSTGQKAMDKREKGNGNDMQVNVINFLNDSVSDNNQTLTEVQDLNNTYTIPVTMTTEVSRNQSSSTMPINDTKTINISDENFTTAEISRSTTAFNKPSHSNTQTTIAYEIHHFTGFIQNVPLHRDREKVHRPMHHLNLVPIEDGPFGSLIWKDKKYLISVLVPIAIGVIGAGCIIGMAYVVRFCHKNEARIHQMKETLLKSHTSRNDQIILLQDSDEEI